jgi:hypothetical protein
MQKVPRNEVTDEERGDGRDVYVVGDRNEVKERGDGRDVYVVGDKRA